jgi:hypothetical protein
MLHRSGFWQKFLRFHGRIFVIFLAEIAGIFCQLSSLAHRKRKDFSKNSMRYKLGVRTFQERIFLSGIENHEESSSDLVSTTKFCTFDFGLTRKLLHRKIGF